MKGAAVDDRLGRAADQTAADLAHDRGHAGVVAALEKR
jgi:hypothetical protein